MKYTYLSLMMAFTSFIHAGIRPADGLWGTSDDPAIGSGLMLTTQNNITVVSVFTYDQTGKNTWYLASGEVNDEGVLEAELRQTQNGANIISENPAAAEFIEQTRTLKLEFTGTQIGTISIGGSEPKSMQAMHFGFYSQPTEQLLLADGTKYRFPSIDGEWVLGDPESGESYVLNLTNYGTGASPPSPNFSLAFLSNHPTTDNWQIFCPQRITSSVQPYCRVFRRGNDPSFSEMRIDLQDLGNQRMTVYQNDVEPFESYQAFRLNKDRRLLPNDGYWRAYDDPDIGSGLVMRTQGDFTVVLIYTYDDEGLPIWQIASGRFDEGGKFSADLLTATGGTAIESNAPNSASFEAEKHTLIIQIQGLELATFSIDDSEPKTMQNYNFGVELFETEHFLVEGQPLKFPGQAGTWAVADYTIENIRPGALEIFEESGAVTPLPPTEPLLYSGFHPSEIYLNSFGFTFDCHRKVINDEIMPSCDGAFNGEDFLTDTRVYFEDIGYDRFRLYVDPPSYIGRDSYYLDFFRLSDY